MGLNITQKIISAHLVEGEMTSGHEIGIKIDQTLTQDATGTMVYLEFAAMGLAKSKAELSLSYIDHNTLQTGFENADDHRFLQSAATKFGVHLSKAGNGICHQVHLERFGIPGKTLLGSDSHTPTCGGVGMLAIGAGGIDVAAAMAGYPFYLQMPKVVNVILQGKPGPWITAKDIILEVLRRLSVKGGIGKVMEYTGEGLKHLSVPERATIANMGAELGATSTVFPSDQITKGFLKSQGREEVFTELKADLDARYDEIVEIDLNVLEPLIAQPHMPDNVVKISEIIGKKVDQVFIGSCTNSSYADLMKVANILKGKKVHPDVSLVVAPGSRQVLQLLASNGALADIVEAGARVLECTCGPCVGVGQAPPSSGVSLRTSNRNFKGRSATLDAQVYLVSCESAVAAAVTGKITDPRTLGEAIKVEQPEIFPIDDSMIIHPNKGKHNNELIMGPNIKPLPAFLPLEDIVSGEVLLKLGDNITTDDIMPAGAKILPLRSNIPAISEYAFKGIDPSFVLRAKQANGGFLIGGENYGQGSSREHAALVPYYLKIRAVIAKSFARIHKQNLINFRILPLMFGNPNDYNNIAVSDILQIENIGELSSNNLIIKNLTQGKEYPVFHDFSKRQIDILLAGGFLEYVKNGLQVGG